MLFFYINTVGIWEKKSCAIIVRLLYVDALQIVLRVSYNWYGKLK